MALVDLRGQEDDPDVHALLALAHGSQHSLEGAVARYRDRAWILIGWEEQSDLVACAGVERDGSDLVVRSLAVAADRRGHGLGRSLLEALAGVAVARRLVADTDEDGVGFYSRCGFTIEEIEPKAGRRRFRCRRALEARPAAPDAVHALTLADLERAIQDSWGHDTSDDPDEWSESNPARGQCAVTALLVRDLLGGEILLANVLLDGARVDRHAWNRLPSGLSVDLTRSQFQEGAEFENPTPGEPLLTDRARYELLRGVCVSVSHSERPPAPAASHSGFPEPVPRRSSASCRRCRSGSGRRRHRQPICPHHGHPIRSNRDYAGPRRLRRSVRANGRLL